MIINIRGTSGSGKTTIVMKLLEKCARREDFCIDGRRRPLMHVCYPDADVCSDGIPLNTIGHYEMPTGGADTVSGMGYIYQLVEECAEIPEHVVVEGLIVQSDVRRCIEMSKRFPLIVIALNTDLDMCLAGIQARRDARGDNRPLNPANTISKMKTLPSQIRRLRDAAVTVHHVGRMEGFEIALEALKWK